MKRTAKGESASEHKTVLSRRAMEGGCFLGYGNPRCVPSVSPEVNNKNSEPHKNGFFIHVPLSGRISIKDDSQVTGQSESEREKVAIGE